MTETNPSLLALEALAELAPEINMAEANVVPVLPSLNALLDEAGPLPREVIFLGIAEDGLPILLNLRDPVPGPLLISADQSAGKTAFLKHLAHSLIKLCYPADVQFGVITANPEEWKGIDQFGHCAGVFPVYQKSAKDFIFSLGQWAHRNTSHQTVLLLVDDLSRMTETHADAKDTFRWLLLRGPARHVWPIVTVNPSKYQDVLPWLELFRTRIFGNIKDTALAEYISDSTVGGLESLVPGTQYALREGPDWLRFWIERPKGGESK